MTHPCPYCDKRAPDGWVTCGDNSCVEEALAKQHVKVPLLYRLGWYIAALQERIGELLKPLPPPLCKHGVDMRSMYPCADCEREAEEFLKK